MSDKNNSWEYSLAKLFKERNNPVEFKPQEAVIISLSPVKVSILNGQVVLEENKQLVISEWFQKRWDIDKAGALSSDLPNLLTTALNNAAQAADTIVIDDYSGAQCEVMGAIDQINAAVIALSQAITINKTELLQLKLDLQLNDRVLIVPAEKEDIFYLVDKIS